MGYSRWTENDYESYAKTTNYRSLSRAEVFSHHVVDDLNPSKIRLRESVDSEQNPNSTPIIFGLDVTGSMGKYAELIAKDELPRLMGDILEKLVVSDPHMMFMGIDDIHAMRLTREIEAFQVSQFEPDIRILEQLRKIYLVGRGGGNKSESYDLAWWFAANRTKIDCFDKRQRKGFLFTIGDEEAPYQSVTAKQFESVFGPGEYNTLSPQQMLEDAQTRYSVFHIVIEQGDYCQGHLRSVKRTWNKMLGKSVLYLRDFRDLSELVICAMQITNGASIVHTIKNSTRPDAMEYAFMNLLTGEYEV